MRGLVLDLFAGPGGWDEGAVGLEHVVGIEHDHAACSTRAAAGHLTVRADVSTYPTEPFVGKVWGLIASPPCTDFSLAGKGAGIEGDSGRLIFEVPRWVEALRPRWVACEQVPPALPWWEQFARQFAELGYMTWTGLLNAADYGVPQTRTRAFLLASLDFQPQAPAPTHTRHPHPALFGDELLPWVSMADALGWGMTLRPGLTVPSHMHGGGPDGFGGSGARAAAAAARAQGDWVVQTGNNSHVTSREGSRAGEGGVELYERPITEPAPTLDAKVGGAWRVVSGSTVAGEGRAERGPGEPAFTVTSRTDPVKVLHTNRGQDADGNRQTRDASAPAPAPALSTKAGGQWWWTDPSTTIGGDPRVSPRCHHDEGMQGRDALAAAAAAAGEGTGIEPIRLTIVDALILQSFRRDYPVHGTKTKQFEQVGNAVPPRLAARVLKQFAAIETSAA